MLKNLFRARTQPRSADVLYDMVVSQARTPAFYTQLGVADRIDARFELYTLHVLLLVLRLRDENTEQGRDAAQSLFDTYVSALDHALRELGVGDVSVGKKMRKLGEALYGRMTAYEAPLRAEDVAALTESLARNVYDNQGADAGPLARYAVESRKALALQPLADVLSGPKWTEIKA